MMIRHILLFFLLTVSTVLVGQDKFHRSYPTSMQDNIQLLDGYATPDGNYFVLGAFLSEDLTKYEYYMLAGFSNKGDLNWQKKIEGIPEAETGTVSGRMILNPGNGIYYSISFDNGGDPYRMVGNYSTGGEKGIHRTYDLNSDSFPGNISLEDFKSNTFLQAGSHYNPDSNQVGLFLGETNAISGDFEWVNTFLGRDTLNTKLGFSGINELFRSTIDSSIIVSGSGVFDGLDDQSFPFIIKADSTGTLQWSRFYRSSSANDIRMNVLDHFETGDSSIFLAGAITTNSFSNGFVARVDKLGQVMWAKQISQGGDIISLIDHITVNSVGIVASGKGLYTSIDTTYDFHLLINNSGEVLQSAEYNALPSNFGYYGDIFGTADGGTMYFTNHAEDGQLVPTLVKTNSELMTSCEDTLAGLTITDLSLVADTLVWEIGGIDTTIVEVEVADTLVFNFSVPILSLESVPFCPREPIDHTFKPEVEGAVLYQWSTGDFSDTLRVMEEGDYSVTVTVADKVCFTVCDTGRISQYEFPEIQMAISQAPFCETGELGVIMQYIQDAPPAMIEWSTGATGIDNIRVTETGTYAVTVTDICEEVAMGDIDVDEFPELVTEVTVDVDEDYCTGNSITLSANANATINSAFWSNGGAGLATNVMQPGVYTVTVTDICDNPLEASATVNPDLIIEPITALEVAPIGGDCILGSLELNASFAGEASSINWNTGSNDQVITVTAPGTYEVNVANECGLVASASIQLEECPECVTYPNVFFPRGQEELNKTFGPILNCGDVITNYELKIFNRWGNLVFESNRVDVEWNGRHGSDPAESGVYVYFAKYDAGVGEQTIEGDVTLIR